MQIHIIELKLFFCFCCCKYIRIISVRGGVTGDGGAGGLALENCGILSFRHKHDDVQK